MFVLGLWQPDKLGVYMRWKHQSSGFLLLWIYRQHFLLIVDPIYQAVWRHVQTNYLIVPWHENLMSWKFTVAMWQCSQFQLYLSTGVVDRSPASDLEFEQGGSPLVSMPAIPVIHLLSDSQLLEKVLLWLYLINIINNKFCNLSYNRSIHSSKVTLCRVRYSASSLYFWYPLFLKVIQ
jgi:hypothetical protein